MASEREIAIVIRAQDEFSEVFDRAGRLTESSALRIKRGFEEMSFADNINQLGEYRTRLQDIIELEMVKFEMEERAVSRRNLAELESSSPYNSIAHSGETELARSAMVYQTKIDQLQAYNTRVIQEMIAAGESRAAIEAKYAELSLAEERQKWQLQAQLAAGGAGALSNFMQNLYIITGSKNNALFEMMKAFAIAQATIKGLEATVNAYAWGAYFGGPAFGAACAVMAATATAAQITQIAAQRPMGSTSSISAGGVANPSYSGGAPSAYPVAQRVEGQPQPSQNVTVIINNPLSGENWQKITDDNIIPAINNALDRNIALTVRYA